MSESNDKRACMKPSSLFITSPDSLSFDTSKSPRSVFDVKKSPRNFEGGVVGLGIVAAMNESSETHDPLSPAISTRTAKSAFSPRSVPIPIVSGKTAAKFRGPIWEEGESELSETYTCVITHIGNEAIKKLEYFDRPGGDRCGNFGNPEHVKREAVFPGSDFLNSCNQCSKKLHGLDIFMYRGEKAFCSAECRQHQILRDELREKCGYEAFDERREKCGYEACKSFDYSSPPCSDPRIFYTGVAAA